MSAPRKGATVPYADQGARREYQRRWVAARRRAWIKANGPCRHCGSSRKLEVDHVDPSTKKYNPTKLWSLSDQRREAELAKCQVLCHACHAVKTAAEKARPITHATTTGYRRGCRCGACRAAASAWNRQYHHRLKVSA